MPRAGTYIGGVKKIKTIGKAQFKGGGLQAGYPGLKSTAHLIAEYIPKSKIYVEPFAGLGRLMRHIKADKIILNDKSPYSVSHNKKKYPGAIIENLDFMECIKKYDSKDTFFLIDPPWDLTSYTQPDNKTDKKPVCDLLPKQYYQKLFEIFPKLKGDWILCGSVHLNHIKEEYGYPIKIVENRYKRINGYPVKTKLASNKPFIRHNQRGLFD